MKTLNIFSKVHRIILVALFVSGFALLFFSPKPPLLENMSFSKAVYDNKHHLLRLTLNNQDKYRLFVPLSDMPPELIEATLLQEDQYFKWHPGVNPIAMVSAAWKTYALKDRRIGASTITMQLARLKFGIHSKTVSGKLLQILRAFQLEWHYSKDELLEAYLNLAPYGGNIEGVGAASLIYFNKPIQKAHLEESLTLSIIPQNPSKRTPFNQNLKHIRDHLFTRWLKNHPGDKDKQASLSLPLQMQNIRSLPFIAPHFVNSLLSRVKYTPSSPQQLVTTLDVSLQRLVEKITRNYIKQKNKLGAYNAAVLLVDTGDMGVKAMLGSADFSNKSIQGQINGTEIWRSPGSTLKPFVYGLALDQGLIHPNTVLKDVPHQFGAYNPENFDYDFMGPIRAKDALVLSRNIPAISLASQLTKPTLYQLLTDAGIHHLKSESYYGLSLTLGAAELSMQELAGLYAMLVNDGLWHPLRMLEKEPAKPGQRLLSPEASFLVLDMLKDTPRETHSKQPLLVSWKTGTSSGYRDAWSVGNFGPYVLVVWIGNFDNTSNPAFVGKNIAAPLFFEIIEALNAEMGPFPSVMKNPKHLNLTKVAVCKASGMLPTRYCQDTEMSWFIPGKSPIKTDTIYREVAIDNLSNFRTCHFNENTRFEIFEFWPSDLLHIFKQAGVHRRTPPPFSPECTFSDKLGLKPQITSPQTGIRYVVRANATEAEKIPFSAITDGDITKVHWFVNDTFLGTTPTNETFFWEAKPGHYVIRVIDEHGQSDARDITVALER